MPLKNNPHNGRTLVFSLIQPPQGYAYHISLPALISSIALGTGVEFDLQTENGTKVELPKQITGLVTLIRRSTEKGSLVVCEVDFRTSTMPDGLKGGVHLVVFDEKAKGRIPDSMLTDKSEAEK